VRIKICLAPSILRDICPAQHRKGLNGRKGAEERALGEGQLGKRGFPAKPTHLQGSWKI